MSNAMRLTVEDAKPPFPRYGTAKTCRPTYPILLVVVMLVGMASFAAWYVGDYSVEERALRGDPAALYTLGKRCFDNAVYPGDYERAAGFIRKAAERGYARAQTGMGLVYENGLGVPLNYAEALKWFRRAASQNYPVAQNELGVMYAKGRGVSRDLTEAARWCRLAAKQGSDIAKKNVQLAEIADARVIAELKTPSAQVYHRAQVQRVDSDGITVSYQPSPGGLGLTKLKLDNLPSELRDLCKYATKQGSDPASAYSHIGSVAATL
jgi:TPR repeat protein